MKYGEDTKKVILLYYGKDVWDEKIQGLFSDI